MLLPLTFEHWFVDSAFHNDLKESTSSTAEQLLFEYKLPFSLTNIKVENEEKEGQIIHLLKSYIPF